VTYAVKEMFYSLQGEGRHAGRPAVFCRFAGCNLWSGRERDRSTADCRFCDTDFVGVDGDGGGRFATAEALSDAISTSWRGAGGQRFAVLTGGEPLLQVDEQLITALHARDFEIALETNGTLSAPPTIDWVTVSPKGSTKLAQTSGHELKLVFPQEGVDPGQFEGLAFGHHLLQPMDGPDLEANTQAAIAYCLEHPQWRLSLQTHKFMGIR
jgi:7-carboxy-7-deazaguanine synthase